MICARGINTHGDQMQVEIFPADALQPDYSSHRPRLNVSSVVIEKKVEILERVVHRIDPSVRL